MSFFGSRRNAPQTEQTPATQEEAQPAAQPQQVAPAQTSRPAAPPQPIGFETVLGAHSNIEGALTSASNVRLDGKFSGSLDIHGNVLVGETADIHADIHAKNISIAGAVHGNVTGKKVQLLRTSRVWGDITAVALSTEEGAFIDGKITMGARDDDKPATEPVAPEAYVTAEPVPDMASEPDFLGEAEAPEIEEEGFEGDDFSAEDDDNLPTEGANTQLS
jgi:cytoskeletal protein CcmA (bactofilin family)